ncbi:MAG: hypothetical protein ACPG5U_00095 [Planktomarina sp.]
MLQVEASLPTGAVLGQLRPALADVIHPAGAIWLQGQADRFMQEGGHVTDWYSNGPTAVQAEPNIGNTALSGTALQLIPERHCGFTIPHITGNAAQFTMAILYSGDDPRTLLTLNTSTPKSAPDVSNYLFLSHTDDTITVKDTHDGISLTAPAQPTSGKRLAIVTLSGHELALTQGLSDPVTIKGSTIGFDAPADLFIGCRSHRKGLLKTLGNAQIHDVIFWPNHTLLLPRTATDVAQYTALKQFYLWGAG